jgi:hypothetical protein
MHPKIQTLLEVHIINGWLCFALCAQLSKDIKSGQRPPEIACLSKRQGWVYAISYRKKESPF